MGPGIKLVEFEDENKVKHRFLYKPPKTNNPASTNVFLGGSDLNLNQYNYVKGLKQLAQGSGGLVVPIYPGYHGDTRQPSESKIKNSAIKICKAIQGGATFRDTFNNGIVEVQQSKKLDLVGYSLGAPVAAFVAEKLQTSITNLTLISPVASIRDFSAELAGEQIPILKKFFSFFRGLFDEEYNTIKSISNTSAKTNIALLSSVGDQFYQTRENNTPSHIEEISASIQSRKGPKDTIIILGTDIPHTQIIQHKEIMEHIIDRSQQTLESKMEATKIKVAYLPGIHINPLRSDSQDRAR